MEMHAHKYMSENEMCGKRAAAFSGDISAIAARRGRERPADIPWLAWTGEKSSYVGISTNSTWGYVFPSCWKKYYGGHIWREMEMQRAYKRYAEDSHVHMMQKQHMMCFLLVAAYLASAGLSLSLESSVLGK